MDATAPAGPARTLRRSLAALVTAANATRTNAEEDEAVPGWVEAWLYVQWTLLIAACVASLFLLVQAMTLHRLKRRVADFLLCVIGLSDFCFCALEALKQHVHLTYYGLYKADGDSAALSTDQFIMSLLSRFCFFMSLYWITNLSLLMRVGNVESLQVKRSFFVSVLISMVYGCIHSTLPALASIAVTYVTNALLLLVMQVALLAVIASNLQFAKHTRMNDNSHGRNVIRRLSGYFICAALFTLPYALVLLCCRDYEAAGVITESLNYLVPIANAILFGTSLPCCSRVASESDKALDPKIGSSNGQLSGPMLEMVTEGPVVKIGEGSSAIVYKAQWLGITVAMKCIRLQGVPEDAEELYMTHMSEIQSEFYDEAVLASKLCHPNITLFIKLSMYKGSVCLVNEYCARGSLRDVLKANPLMEWSTKVRLAFEAAKGLAFMHNRDPIYLHRDLKASNILVTEDWTAKISDFGISRIATDFTTKKLTMLSTRGGLDIGASTLTTFAGTWRWNAPEVMQNPNECRFNRETDMYSFGMALWEVLTNGAVPFGDVAFDHQVRSLVASGERPKFPPVLLRRAPPEFVDIIRECWAQSPHVRPSAQDVMLRLGSLAYTISNTTEGGSARVTSRHIFSDNYYQAVDSVRSYYMEL